jgi:outer membrane protein TolC
MVSASMLTAPAFAGPAQQSQEQTQAPAPAPAPAAQSVEPAHGSIAQSATPEPERDLRPSLGKDYSKAPRPFPNLFLPYLEQRIAAPNLSNSPHVNQLVQNGKLTLSLEDAITLALENNLNINVARYTPWLAEVDILRAKSGQPFLGTPQLLTETEGLGTTPVISFDPVITGTFNDTFTVVPVNNPFISGTGTLGALPISEHILNGNIDYSEGFHTGTTVTVGWNNQRTSISPAIDFFNPAVQSNITIGIQQQLLNGFGKLPNTRYIVEAKNERQAADFYFATQVISTIVTTENAYWELVYSRANVRVNEAALATSTKLYNDNKRQLEIGTMAPLDVLTAESEVAADKQNLIVAQTNQLQQQTVLLNAITKQLMAPELQGVEIVPTTPIETPANTDLAPLPDAVAEAFGKRPEIKQSELLLKNAGIDVKVSRNALLPVLTLYGQYESQGLGGNAVTTTETPAAFAPDLSSPLVGPTGTPVLINNQPVYAGTPSAYNIVSSITAPGGFTNAQSQIFHNDFPTYTFGLNLTLPLRNRAAQADNARAQLFERSQEAQLLQLQNSVVVGVRNAQIAVEQGRAQVEAAIKATELAKQTLDAEQKKYQLGASTSYNVILRSRDLTTAEGNELRARANLQEALVSYNQAMGRTLEVNRIEVANMQGNPSVTRTQNIPGALAHVHLTPNPGGWMGSQ